jgi:hypothetical protein
MRRQPRRSHLRHGDSLNDCGLLSGTQTCENPKRPCNTSPTFRGEGCACFVTTTGGSIGATNSVVCRPGTTCVTDDDRANFYGAGYVCVPTFGCDIEGCGASGNAGSAPCHG